MNKDEILMIELTQVANDYGFKVNDYDQLYGTKRKIKKLIPVLLNYLELFESRKYKNALIGLLGVKGFNDATETLLNKYYDKSCNINKWSIGDALYSIQDKRF